MSPLLFWLGIGVVLFVLGWHGVLITQQAIRRIIAVNVMGSGVFMVMVALATRHPHGDAVLHALVVTGLVVAVSATAFALRLATATQHDEGDA